MSEAEVGAENVVAEQTVFAGLCNGVFKTLNGQRIFGADVDEALVGANGVAGDGHGFENGVGVAFAGGAVHVGARVTFVSVTKRHISDRTRRSW